MGLQRDRAGPLGDLGRGDLGRGDDQDLRVGQQLSERDRHVAGARRQVEQQDVEVAPVHVGQELLERAVQHRAAPDDGRVAGREHADRDDLHAVRRRRHDHLFDLGRPAGRAEHPGHRVAVDVRVDHERPRAASAAARLTVTLDLPTPPLPLATAYTRVREPG